MTARDKFPASQTRVQMHPAPHPERLRLTRAYAAKNGKADSGTDRQAAQKPRVDRPDNCQSAFGRIFGSRSINGETRVGQEKFLKDH